jgi:hypothetical protein
MNASSNLPPDLLEKRAEEQRERIAESVIELKDSVRETVREHLDVNTYARKHFTRLASIASLFAFATGYAFAGMFTRD